MKNPDQTCGCCGKASPFAELCGGCYVYELGGHSPENLWDWSGELLDLIREYLEDGPSEDLHRRMTEAAKDR